MSHLRGSLKGVIFGLICLALSAASNAGPINPSMDGNTQRWIVQIDKGDMMPASILPNAASQIAAQHGVTPVMSLGGTVGGFVVETSETVARDLRNNRNVRAVVPDIQFRVMSDVGWALPRISHRDRVTSGPYNDRGLSGNQVRIYVVDNGVRASHQELAGRVESAFDIFDQLEEDYEDTCFRHSPLFHGTAVASKAAGTNLGPAHQATILDARVLDCDGHGRLSWLIDGLEYIGVREHARSGFAVVNLSLGSDDWQQDDYTAMGFSSAKSLLRDAIDGLPDTVLPVAAAGNRDRPAADILPAALDEVLTVGGTDDSDRRFRTWVTGAPPCGRPGPPCIEPLGAFWFASNYGAAVDLFAPGFEVRVASAQNDHGNTDSSGTSFSAPLTAGVAAIYAEHVGRLTAKGDEIRDMLLQNASEGYVRNLNGSPDRLLYNDPDPDEGSGLPDCPWKDDNGNWIICP